MFSLAGCGAGYVKPGLSEDMQAVKRIGIIITDVNYPLRKAFYLEDSLVAEMTTTAKEHGYAAIQIPENSPDVAKLVEEYTNAPRNWRGQPGVNGFEAARDVAKKFGCDTLLIVSGKITLTEVPDLTGTAAKIAFGVVMGAPVAGGATDATILNLTGLTPDGTVGYYERTQFTTGTFRDGSLLPEKNRRKIAQTVMEQYIDHFKVR